jgi:hypothetical protein
MSKGKKSLLVKLCQKYENDAMATVTGGSWILGIGKSEPSERMKEKIKASLNK